MLSLSNVGNGAAAASYYEEADDYYTGDRSPSAWWGQGAESLGLAGGVDATMFAGLLDGRLPTGETLHHAAAGRRGGTDATFSAPKSVSLQALVGGDTRLLMAHQRAVDRALGYAETLAACRVTEDGQTRSVRTGNMVVARFEHDLSRACDPQLHTHCVIINATRRADGQWRAMDNEALYRHKMMLGALYRNELAREVQALGYEVRTTHWDGRFELGHINERQVRAFSQRSAAIEAYLQDQGSERSEASAWTKKLIAVLTRDKKTTVDRQVLRDEWHDLSRQQGIDYTSPLAHDQDDLQAKPEKARAVVTEALLHLGEREAVFSKTDLLRAALEGGVGVATLDELEIAIDQCQHDGLLIVCGERYTTPGAQQLEAEILALEVSGRDALVPLVTSDRAALLEALASLKPEQREAAMAVLLTRNQVMGIQGRAGVGKTTLLTSMSAVASSCGYSVRGLAPSASAARELSAAGIAAETIATFDKRDSKGLDAKTLLVIDEAGMASTRQMHLILQEAINAKCRVLLVGDTAQLAAVEAGKPFAQLQANGMATAVVSQIQRQQNPKLKQAVELVVGGQVRLAVELLDKEIVQVVSATERFKRIASDYVALPEGDRAQTRVIAGTRQARAAINKEIREQLGIGADGQAVVLLTRKDLTDAQRRSTLSYDVGDVVQAEIDYASLGLKRGDTARVVARLDHRVLLEREDGKQVAWQPANSTRLSAFVPEAQRLNEGDLVRVTANDRSRGLVNGDLARVTGFDAEGRITITLANGAVVWLDAGKPLTLDYGYCSTVYASQGQTCEKVMIEADAYSLTASQNTFYVALSRARQNVSIYTDDREMLPLAMSREMDKASALDLAPRAVEMER